MQSSVPVSVITNLKCGHCRKFVTCGPVHLTFDSSILCGRCAKFSKQIYRNLPLEALASNYKYPCHFWSKHCNKKLAWNESLDHERNCLFQSSCNVFCSRPGTFFKSERKLPINSDIALEHVTEEQLDQLKCVACESYLSNVPIFTLIDGKSVCHRCCHNNGPPNNSVRNLAYETIASAFIFPCIYRFRGCTIRLRYGRDMWIHEHECAYGQIQRLQSFKKTPQKNGKERGVIETHSGHYWGTITPHSALFAPPKTKKNDGKFVTQELEEVMKKKQKDDSDGKNFDAESMDSIVTKSTWDSLADNISSHTVDNISRSTVDNISRASSRDPRLSSNPPLAANYRSSFNNYNELNRLEKIRQSNEDLGIKYIPYTEVLPTPLPAGFNKASSGHYQDNVARFAALEQYGHLSHYPPVLLEMPNTPTNLNHSSSFNYPVKRTESARIGNADIINELKERNRKKMSTASSESNNPEQSFSHDNNNVFK